MRATQTRVTVMIRHIYVHVCVGGCRRLTSASELVHMRECNEMCM